MPRPPITPNLVYNGNFEIAPPFTAPTTGNGVWVDGTAAGSTAQKAYGWSNLSGAVTNASSQFDSTTVNRGNYSFKLSCLTTGGTITCGTYRNITALELFPVAPNTSYTLAAYVKTNNVAANSAFLDFRQLNSSLSAITTNSTNKLSGTNDWTLCTLTVTTQPTCVLGAVFLRNNVAGNISDAWFDEVFLFPTALVNRALL